MLQEELQQRTVALSIQTASLTATVLKAAIVQVLQTMQETETALKHGKMTLQQLQHHRAALSNIEIADGNIKDFDRIAKAYGLDYALKKDNSTEPPKYLVFFKGRDLEVINAAFREYVADRMGQGRPSIREQLSRLREQVAQQTAERLRRREREPEL